MHKLRGNKCQNKDTKRPQVREENVHVVANHPFTIVRNVQHAKLYVLSADRKVTFNQCVDLQTHKESVVVI